jgi:putative lipoic acid-binding regulatory protein
MNRLSVNSTPSLMHFPGEFCIKIMGQADSNFKATALGIVRQHFPYLTETAVQLNPSRNQRYLALRVTLTVDSQAQLDGLYQALSQHPAVLFVI